MGGVKIDMKFAFNIVGPVSGSSETLSLLGVIAGGWVGSEIGKEFDKKPEDEGNDLDNE